LKVSASKSATSPSPKTLAEIVSKNLTYRQMYKIFVLIFLGTKNFSQTDKNGNPVFNSVTTKEESVKDFQLISNYYTLKTNIENKK